MLAAYAAQVKIDDVALYPISFYWELVLQGNNKGNFVSGGGCELRTEASKEHDMIARTEQRIKELKAQGQWPNPEK